MNAKDSSTVTQRSSLQKELSGVGSLVPISIKEAKQVMGDSAKGMSDDDIQQAIYHLTAIARAFVRTVPKYKPFTAL